MGALLRQAERPARSHQPFHLITPPGFAVTINKTVSVAVTPKVVLDRMREYGLGYEVDRLSVAAQKRVAKVLVAFIDLPEDDREVFIKGIRSLVCHECGKASCLCGYSDC